MKKLAILLLSLVLITGCSKKNKLSCEATTNSNGDTYNTSIKLKYKNNKVAEANYIMSVKLANKNLNLYNAYYNSFVETYSSLKNKDGVNINFNKSDNGYSVAIKINYDKFSGTASFINTNLDRNQAKTYYENLNYTCK